LRLIFAVKKDPPNAKNIRSLHNIALVGFMGTGKSSVGRTLADQLGYEFVDTDVLVEAAAGKSIPDIFAQDGEAVFRKIESVVVEKLTLRRKTIIATGGGLVTNPDNLALLKAHSLVVCLWASAETIFQRVRHQTHRPLLQCAEPQARIRELLSAREPFYRKADVLVNTELRSARDVAQQILHQYHLAKSGR
jgi:shikimate kinase